MKHQVYNKGILAILGNFSQCEMLMSLECTVDSERNGVFNSLYHVWLLSYSFEKSQKIQILIA